MSAFFDYELPAPRDRNPSHLGLHVADGGEIELAGKRFCGFGVNYFGAFAHYWYDDYNHTPFGDAFAKLKEYGVDFIRMPFGGYWTDYYEAFAKDPDAVLRCLDRVVEEAERAHIGIIVSLFWHDTALPLYLGEHRAAMGDPESETVKYGTDGDHPATIVSPMFVHASVKSADTGPDVASLIQTFVCQFHRTAESSSTRNVTFVPVPPAGTLPVPVQPVQTYRTPLAGSGSATFASTSVPHEIAWMPFVGNGSPHSLFTIRSSFFSLTVTSISRGPSTGIVSVVSTRDTPSTSPESEIS